MIRMCLFATLLKMITFVYQYLGYEQIIHNIFQRYRYHTQMRGSVLSRLGQKS